MELRSNVADSARIQDYILGLCFFIKKPKITKEKIPKRDLKSNTNIILKSIKNITYPAQANNPSLKGNTIEQFFTKFKIKYFLKKTFQINAGNFLKKLHPGLHNL